jgi:hypothetical protein
VGGGECSSISESATICKQRFLIFSLPHLKPPPLTPPHWRPPAAVDQRRREAPAMPAARGRGTSRPYRFAKKFPTRLFRIVVRLFCHCFFVLVHCSCCAAACPARLSFLSTISNNWRVVCRNPPIAAIVFFHCIFIVVYNGAPFFAAPQRQTSAAKPSQAVGFPSPAPLARGEGSGVGANVAQPLNQQRSASGPSRLRTVFSQRCQTTGALLAATRRITAAS